MFLGDGDTWIQFRQVLCNKPSAVIYPAASPNVSDGIAMSDHHPMVRANMLMFCCVVAMADTLARM